MIETITGPFGDVTRTMGEDASAVLGQLPQDQYPDPDPACATCPGAAWYLTKKTLRCFCREHRFTAWVSNVDPVLVCDTREQLIAEATAAS